MLDIVPLEVGFIYAQKTRLSNGQDTVAFYVYDQDGDRTLPVKIKTYLEAKFGFQYREIAKKLGCEIFMYDDLGHAAYEEAKDFNQRVYNFLQHK